ARNTYAAYVPLPPVAARSPLSDSVALSARTARATGPPAPSLPETPLVVSFLCTAQNHSSSPESFVVCLSISSGGNLLYIPVERETLFRVSLGHFGHFRLDNTGIRYTLLVRASYA